MRRSAAFRSGRCMAPAANSRPTDFDERFVAPTGVKRGKR